MEKIYEESIRVSQHHFTVIGHLGKSLIQFNYNHQPSGLPQFKARQIEKETEQKVI